MNYKNERWNAEQWRLKEEADLRKGCTIFALVGSFVILGIITLIFLFV